MTTNTTTTETTDVVYVVAVSKNRTRYLAWFNPDTGRSESGTHAQAIEFKDADRALAEMMQCRAQGWQNAHVLRRRATAKRIAQAVG